MKVGDTPYKMDMPSDNSRNEYTMQVGNGPKKDMYDNIKNGRFKKEEDGLANSLDPNASANVSTDYANMDSNYLSKGQEDGSDNLYLMGGIETKKADDEDSLLDEISKDESNASVTLSQEEVNKNKEDKDLFTITTSQGPSKPVKSTPGSRYGSNQFRSSMGIKIEAAPKQKAGSSMF